MVKLPEFRLTRFVDQYDSLMTGEPILVKGTF